MSPRLRRWSIFSVGFTCLPLVIDYLIVLGDVERAPRGIVEVIGGGELCLIATALAAVGHGEVSGAKAVRENVGIDLGGASLANVVMGIALYVMIKAKESSAVPPLYLILSVLLLLSSIVVATSCVVASEARDG